MGCAGSVDDSSRPRKKSRHQGAKAPKAKTIVATPPEDAIEILPSEDVTSETAAWCRKRYLFQQAGVEQRALEDLERSRSSAGRGSHNHSRGGASHRSSLGGASSSPNSSIRFGGRSRHPSEPCPDVALELGGALERLLTPQSSPLLALHSGRGAQGSSATRRSQRSPSPPEQQRRASSPPLAGTAPVIALPAPPNVFDLLESADDDDTSSDSHAPVDGSAAAAVVVRPLRAKLSHAHLPIPLLVTHGDADVRSPSSSMPFGTQSATSRPLSPLPHRVPDAAAAEERSSPAALPAHRASSPPYNGRLKQQHTSPPLEALGAKFVAPSTYK